MSIKTLPVSFFENQGPKALGAIWGINTCDQSVVGQKGEVILAIPKSNGTGDPDKVLIQDTWLPQELTRDIPRRRLLSSSEFRRAVGNQLIGLVDEETAHRMLRQSGAKDEQQRLREMSQHIKESGAARSITDNKGSSITRADGIVDEEDSDLNKTTILDHGDNVAKQAKAGVEDIEPGISASFKMFCDKLGTGTDANAKMEIRGRRSFTKAEIAFLHRNLPRKFVETLALLSRNIKK